MRVNKAHLMGALFAAGLLLTAVYFAVAGPQKPAPDPLDKALEAYDSADYRLAIKLLSEKPIQQRPKNVLISAYLNSGRYGAATQLLEELLEEAGDDTEAATALYLLSQIARSQKDHEKAASLIQHAMSIDHRPQLRRALAEIYLEAGRNEQAVSELEQLLGGETEGIDVAEARSKLAAAYQALGQTERARQVQQDATGEGVTP